MPTTMQQIRTASSTNLRRVNAECAQIILNPPSPKAREVAVSLRTIVTEELAERVVRENFRPRSMFSTD